MAHPDEFSKRELALKNDEQHAKQMLELLPKAFLFDAPQTDGPFLRIAFKPNPDYSPASLEERVLHSMNGSLMVDRDAMRLHKIEGRLPADVNIGFGLLATIHAGSNFFYAARPRLRRRIQNRHPRYRHQRPRHLL